MRAETELPTGSVEGVISLQTKETATFEDAFAEFGNGHVSPEIWENEAFLDKLVACTVLPARYRLKLTDTDWEMHRQDMAQAALETFYEFSHQPFGYILGIIRHRLADYALINIYGRQAGYNSQYSRNCYVQDIPQPEIDREAFLAAFTSSNTVTRPVEAAVIDQESEEGRQRFWYRVEREIMAIMVATGGSKSRPDRLRGYTQVLVKRLQGKTNSSIALEMELPLEDVLGILERARQRIREFQALSSVMQGLLWAWGHMNVYWPGEITSELLNCGRKFVAVLPHGEFNVSYCRKRCYVQMGSQVKNKVYTRQVTIGELGSLTYSQLYQGTLQLNEKLGKLRQIPKT